MAFRSRWKIAVLLGSLAVFVCVFLDRDARPNFSDFSVYWVAGGKAAEHETVYDVAGHYQFKYSPFVATLWAIPTKLPGSRYAWRWLHWLATGTGFCAVWYLLARALDRRRSFALWLALLAVFVVGLRDELKLGQANLWPFLLILPAFFVGPRPAQERGFDLTGFAIGAAWGIAIQWKLYALVLAPLWLLRRRLQVWIGAACITLLTLVGVQAIVHGWDFALAENARWVRTLTASSEQLLVSQYNVSLLGIFGKLAAYGGGKLGLWAYALWAVAAVAWLACLSWAELAAKARNAAQLRFWAGAFCWAGITIFNPLVWPYWLILCVPLFLVYVVAGTADGLRDTDPAFWCVCALFAGMNWAQNHAIVHAGGSLLAILALLIDAYRRARGPDHERLTRWTELHFGVATPTAPR